jgi:acylphosphatase/archaellum component FlaC
MLRLTAFISGMVQKTGYRANVVILANAFGLQGYVQNLPNGKVKVVAEGEQTDLERFLSCLSIKDALIDVQSIENEYTAATGDFIGFEKMVSGGETDQRLDKAADLLKDLIVVSKEIVVELKGSREDIKGVRDEVKGARDDIKGVHEAVQNVCQAVNNIGEILAEKIDDARDEVISEVKELRCDLRDDLKERLIRMEADVSQIKAKCGL